jgi:superfamily II DNA/RNA helicase
VKNVINFDFPESAEAYVHRVGRWAVAHALFYLIDIIVMKIIFFLSCYDSDYISHIESDYISQIDSDSISFYSYYYHYNYHYFHH